MKKLAPLVLLVLSICSCTMNKTIEYTTTCIPVVTKAINVDKSTNEISKIFSCYNDKVIEVCKLYNNITITIEGNDDDVMYRTAKEEFLPIKEAFTEEITKIKNDLEAELANRANEFKNIDAYFELKPLISLYDYSDEDRGVVNMDDLIIVLKGGNNIIE